ncbi:MAG: type 1 glutamine amidotransferase [Akkermansiaceae bacterium]|jgi:type 1 glutamine amidotransferase
MKNPRNKHFLLAILAFSLFSEVQAEPNVEVLVKSGDSASTADRFLYYARQNNSHHRPASFMTSVRRDFGERGIQFTTSINPNDLNLEKFRQFDGVFFFGNHGVFTAAQSNDIESYLSDGGGMVGMHVIAYVARGNPTLSRLLGASFRGHHAIQTFTSPLIQSAESYPRNPDFPFTDGGTYDFAPDHPILEGLEPYTSADEPYLHQTLNRDIVLLAYRDDFGNWDEPYTWVRHEGSGRVFYHANGHDARTWSQPNFRELMIRGTSWVSRAHAHSHQTLFPPLLSAQGNLQHMSLVETSEGPELAIHTRGQESARHGRQLPGDDESLQYLLTETSSHTMFGDDQIILRTKAQSADQELGVLLAGHSRYPQLIALATGPAGELEAGFRFSADQDFPFVSDTQDTFLFSARIEDSAGGNQKKVVALSQNGVLTPLLVEGDPFGEDPATTIIGLPENPIYCSGSTEVAIIAQLQIPSSPVATHILTGTPEALTSRVTTGITSSGLPLDSFFEEFLQPFAIKEAHLYFTARLGGGSTLATNDEVIARTNPLGESVILLREGDLVQAQPLSFPADPITPTLRENDLLCVGKIAGKASLISVETGRPPAILVSEGETLMVEGEFHTIASLRLTSMMVSARQVVLPTRLIASDGITERSCLLQIGSGTIRPLLLEGQQIQTPGDHFTVSEISCRPTGPHGGGIHDTQIRVLATSALGESAIVAINNIDDLDQDGISDTVEIAFGGSLVDSNSLIPPGYPTILSTPEGAMTLSYWQQIETNAHLQYTIETSPDLLSWTPTSLETSPAQDQSGVAANYKKMTATITATEEYRFFRFTF